MLNFKLNLHIVEDSAEAHGIKPRGDIACFCLGWILFDQIGLNGCHRIKFRKEEIKISRFPVSWAGKNNLRMPRSGLTTPRSSTSTTAGSGSTPTGWTMPTTTMGRCRRFARNISSLGYLPCGRYSFIFNE